jgi:transposase
MRRKTGKKPGGQRGHAGETAQLMAVPDQIIEHHPATCTTCQAPLVAGAGVTEVVVRERRQVQDLPPIRLRVTEHQAPSVHYPACQQVSVVAFPPEVASRAQYAPRLRALAAYLVAQQFVPYARPRPAARDADRDRAGAEAFARLHSYLSTLRKQGAALLAALHSLFTDSPLDPAWG